MLIANTEGLQSLNIFFIFLFHVLMTLCLDGMAVGSVDPKKLRYKRESTEDGSHWAKKDHKMKECGTLLLKGCTWNAKTAQWVYSTLKIRNWWVPDLELILGYETVLQKCVAGFGDKTNNIKSRLFMFTLIMRRTTKQQCDMLSVDRLVLFFITVNTWNSNIPT